MSNEPSRPKSPDERVAELEFLFTHLERQVADLNRVVLEQQARIEEVEKELRALRQQVQPADETPEELDEP